MTPDLERLKALHGKMTPGEWEVDGLAVKSAGEFIAMCSGRSVNAHAICEIVNAFPGLVERIEYWKGQTDIALEAIKHRMEIGLDLAAERDDLKARLAELEDEFTTVHMVGFHSRDDEVRELKRQLAECESRRCM